MLRLFVIVAVSMTLAACIPMPQRVKDEFSRYDGERPNNFRTTRERAGPEAVAPAAGTTAADTATDTPE